MSVTVLGDERPTARKTHRCDVCRGVIAPGDTYTRQRNVADGECYTFKAHALCDAAYWKAHRDCGLWDDDMPDWGDSVAPLVLAFFAALAEMRRGELLGLVGESGAGKSLTALALLRLVPPPGRIAGGRVRLGGQDLLDLPETTMRSVRGGRIAMVFQEPQAALNPVFTVGAQIVETIRAHRPLSRREAKAEAFRLLELVAMPDPEQRLRSYPHQLSGGQRQRAMLAVALAGEPELLVADEPTTALDVTIQAQILDLLQRLRRELGLSVLLITHDLAVVAETCDRVCVLYAGLSLKADRLLSIVLTPFEDGS
jgi:ABC-type dipeptide/oligopeptide/nickel transport system ATPase component